MEKIRNAGNPFHVLTKYDIGTRFNIIKVLTIEEAGDVDVHFISSDKFIIYRWPNIKGHKDIKLYADEFLFDVGCQVIPPSQGWLDRCIKAIEEYNEYYRDEKVYDEDGIEVKVGDDVKIGNSVYKILFFNMDNYTMVTTRCATWWSINKSNHRINGFKKCYKPIHCKECGQELKGKVE